MSTALGVYLVMSVIAFAVYSIDKRRAVRGEWRVSEATLHALEMLGGWPGAWIAQQALRHKNQKRRYMTIFGRSSACTHSAWAWWLSDRNNARHQPLISRSRNGATGQVPSDNRPMARS